MAKFEYVDPFMLVKQEAEKAGMLPAAVEVLQAQVSRETTEGHWTQVHGQPIRNTGPGAPFETAAEFVASLETTHPDYWPVDKSTTAADKEDEAVAPEMVEAAFGANPTLTARGALMKAIGADAYNETMKAWGADLSLRPGTPPSDEKKAASVNDNPGGFTSSTNPWSKSFVGSEEYRQTRIQSIIKSSSKLAASLAKSANVTISGQVLRK
jgi:hypothetical protein